MGLQGCALLTEWANILKRTMEGIIVFSKLGFGGQAEASLPPPRNPTPPLSLSQPTKLRCCSPSVWDLRLSGSSAETSQSTKMVTVIWPHELDWVCTVVKPDSWMGDCCVWHYFDGTTGVSRDSMLKRRATGGEKKAWRRKREWKS